MHAARRHFLSHAGALAVAGLAAPPALAAGISVTDSRNQRITLAAPARRVVCLIESALSGLYMLGAQNTLVGVPANAYQGDAAPHYARLDPRLAQRQLPAPGNWDFISLEGILACRPDLVILWAHQREAIAAVEARGIPVYAVFIAGTADLRREIRDLGRLTGTGPRAEALIAQTDATLAQLAATTHSAPAARPSVYFMWGQSTLDTACQGSAVDELIELAGGRNVCRTRAEHATVGMEHVMGWNPDIVVMWNTPRQTPQTVSVDPQWQRIRAVKTGRVYQLPEGFDCDLWTLKFQHAVRLLAAWCYPARFPGLDMARERRRMMASLYGNAYTG